jgi:alpha-ketoglutarate-dependent taurine dioxygenase
MLNIKSIKNSSYSDIVANVDDYIKIFLDNGLVCFKQVYLSTFEQEHVVNLFAEKLKWNYVSDVHTEDHIYTISMHEKTFDKDEIIIDWHIEHLERMYTQVATSWNMTKFTCPKGHGNTGFIDSSYLYSLMPDDWQEFLKSIIVTHRTMNFPHRRCVIKHRNSGKNILRLIPHFAEDLLVSVNNNNPSDQEFLLFNKIKTWYCNQVRNNESIQMWQQWDEGDCIVLDLLYMIHCVKGGFTSKDRQFTRNWAYAKKSDFLKYAKQ